LLIGEGTEGRDKVSTIVEKILSRASGTEARAGDRVWASVDVVAMRDFGGPNAIAEYGKNFGDKPPFDPKKIVFTFDLYAPARNERVAKNQKICREFAKKHGCVLFDVQWGIGQHTLLENGFVGPGDVIIGTDSHMNLLGAVGAFAVGVGTTDIVAAMAEGKLWFRVPETIKIVVDGAMKRGVYPKDLILSVVGDLGTSGALYKSIEFDGTLIRKLSLDGRITIMSMITEMSAKTGFIIPDAKLLNYINSRRRERGLADTKLIYPDPDAEYFDVLYMNAGEVEPVLACPHSPANVKIVSDVEGVEVDQVFIGSCTNGRFEDMLVAAEILHGRKVADNTRLIIVPATVNVLKKMLETGVYDTLVRAGAIIGSPSCALCTTGHPGILAEGEVMVSTSNRNFPGKLGKGAEVYLASPATAAATAIEGKITDPRKYL